MWITNQNIIGSTILGRGGSRGSAPFVPVTGSQDDPLIKLYSSNYSANQWIDLASNRIAYTEFTSSIFRDICTFLEFSSSLGENAFTQSQITSSVSQSISQWGQNWALGFTYRYPGGTDYPLSIGYDPSVLFGGSELRITSNSISWVGAEENGLVNDRTMLLNGELEAGNTYKVYVAQSDNPIGGSPSYWNSYVAFGTSSTTLFTGQEIEVFGDNMQFQWENGSGSQFNIGRRTESNGDVITKSDLSSIVMWPNEKRNVSAGYVWNYLPNVCDNMVTGGMAVWLTPYGYTSGSSVWDDYSGNNNDVNIISSSFILSGSTQWNFEHTGSQAAYMNLVSQSNFPTSSYTFQLYGTIVTRNPLTDPQNGTNQIFSRDSEPIDDGWYWEYSPRTNAFRYESVATTAGTGSPASNYVAEITSSGYNLEASKSLFTFMIDSVNHTGSIWINETKLGEFSGLGTGTGPQFGAQPFIISGSNHPVLMGDSNYQIGRVNIPFTFSGSVESIQLYNRTLNEEEIVYLSNYITYLNKDTQ